MKVFITGASGMLGSALMRHYAVNGHKVRGYDVFSEQASITVGDIRNATTLNQAMLEFGPDRVYHCAAMLGVQNTENNPNLCREINEYGTQIVYTAAQLARAKSFIFTSSSEVYGDPGDDTPMAETYPLKGNNVYARGKARSEHYLLNKDSDMKIVIARMFNCYGLGQVKQFFVPKVVHQLANGQSPHLFGNPENKRCYLYAQDAAMFLSHIADRANNGEIVNVSSNEVLRLKDVVMKTAAAFPNPVIPHYVVLPNTYDDRSVSRDIPNRIADTTRLRQISTSVPTLFTKGIARVVQYRSGLREGWVYDTRLMS